MAEPERDLRRTSHPLSRWGRGMLLWQLSRVRQPLYRQQSDKKAPDRRFSFREDGSEPGNFGRPSKQLCHRARIGPMSRPKAPVSPSTSAWRKRGPAPQLQQALKRGLRCVTCVTFLSPVLRNTPTTNSFRLSIPSPRMFRTLLTCFLCFAVSFPSSRADIFINEVVTSASDRLLRYTGGVPKLGTG